MFNIRIKVIPHKKQRYDTSGDYWIDKKGNIQFRISDMENWQYEAYIIIHELTEFFLTKARGIPIKKIDKFDMKWKEHDDIDEPGNDPTAPYFKEHQFATVIERMLVSEMGNSWDEYNNSFNKLKYK